MLPWSSWARATLSPFLFTRIFHLLILPGSVVLGRWPPAPQLFYPPQELLGVTNLLLPFHGRRSRMSSCACQLAVEDMGAGKSAWTNVQHPSPPPHPQKLGPRHLHSPANDYAIPFSHSAQPSSVNHIHVTLRVWTARVTLVGFCVLKP